VEKDMTVFITQQLLGRDLTDATSFGDLEVLLLADEQTSSPTQHTISHFAHKLSAFTDEDYLLLAGDPAAIAVAAAIASLHNEGRFSLLKWDRQKGQYLVLKVDLNSGDNDD
jgi:hypothetical protein|tara:strand:+ start:471 stop:806 length:336 start_codon:yes stop_codon:yes gene_type:complete